MRIVITGATGYIGARLAASAEAANWETHALVRPGSDRCRLPGNVRPWIYDGGVDSLLHCLSEVQPDVVMNLAAAGGSNHGPTDIQPMMAANLFFGTQLLEAMSITSCSHLVNTGSYWEYDSEGRYAPNTLYAAMKRGLQDLILFYCRSRGLKAITLVMYDVYGPSDWRDKLVPQLVQAVHSGERLPATAGEQMLDFVYVDDVCAGFMQAACRLMATGEPGHAVYALRTGEPRRIKDLVNLLESIANRALKIGWGEIPYPADQIFHPAESIPALPGWHPAKNLEAGLRQIIAEAIYACK